MGNNGIHSQHDKLSYIYVYTSIVLFLVGHYSAYLGTPLHVCWDLRFHCVLPGSTGIYSTGSRRGNGLIWHIKTLMISDPRIEGCVVLILMRCRVFQLTLLPFTTVLSCCLCRYKKILDLSFIGSCQILGWFACVYVWCILLCVNDSFINVEVYCTCEYKIIKDIIKYLLVDCKKRT